jgi:site-specific recombinase XerD
MKITNELLFNRKERMLNKDFSINTIMNYETDVKTFINYLRIEKLGYTVDTKEITLIEIEKWKTYLRNLPTPKNSIYYSVKPTISQSTIQSKLTAVKSLLKYINLFYDEGLDYKKIETKRIKSDYIEYLTQTEFELLEKFI